MRFIATFVFVVLLSVTASAQMADEADLNRIERDNSLGVSATESPFSLLDFSRIKWSHSYSVSYFTGGYGSGTQGLFNTSMLYELSPKLSLSLNLGVAHSGGVFKGDGSTASFLPGFTLDYHPSNKFRMTFSVQTYRGYMNPYYYDRSSHWLNSIGP